MRKVLIAVLIISAFLSSCKKEDKSAFDKSPDERLNETLAAYQTQLSGAQNGWKALIQVDSGKGATYSFYFKFNDANRVVMLSDFDSLSAVTPKESSYRLKALQQPSLVFDTYSYLHVLSDPDPRVNGQNFGAGLLSDFEFYFDSSTADVIKLVGRIHGSKLILIKATQAEEDAYNNGALASGLNINKILTYFKRLTIGSQFYDIRIDPVTRKFIFSWLDANGNPVTFTTGYYFTAGGISFTNPLVNGSQTIPGFSNISWNQAAETINLTSGSTAATITGTVLPIKVDVSAPRRWWQDAINNGQTYWFSINGFHVNGIDDAFGITTLPRYFYLIYWPAYDQQNDLFAPVFINAAGTGLDIQYGTGPSATFTPDGRAIFVEISNYGTYPATGPAALSKTLLYNSSGYYFVQTSATTYDMVSAADGKAWVSWRF
ncbi:MAG TPA: DUF4302 domain-containing protein [Chitinophagaceae bacterium]|nr:DUF4302 domain-containing protein [Chitinophagaceae bacterium]